MRDDFLTPNLGQAPKEYQETYLNRVVRNIEMTFRLMQSIGRVQADVISLRGVPVADLPVGRAGNVAYASNGRKNGEGAGAGTGVLVFHDGTNWKACDSGATVSA